MGQTKAGAAKMKQVMIDRFGSEEAYRKWLAEIGRQGGKNGRGAGYIGGFAHPNSDPITAGALGGRISRRTKRVS